MIASWMLYAFLVAALITLAATALERVALARRWPIRFVWTGAVLLSIAWPVGSAVRELMPMPTKTVTVLPFTITVYPARIAASQSITPDFAAVVDRSLVVLWIALSALLLFRLSQGVITLQRTRRGWTRGDIDGTSVRLSDNVGPAVVGLRSMDVVIPEWIMTLDAPLRAIVLRHEEEHRSARDPYLLFAAAIAVALMPWNVALWMQARRLRLAIEMDCDARVLRAHPSPERYGLLMLTIAQRRSVAPTLFAPMLSEPTTQLEHRIIAMRTTTRRLARVTVYAGTAVAIGALAFACSLQAGGGTFATPVASRLLNATTTLVAPAPEVTKPVVSTATRPAPRKPVVEQAPFPVQQSGPNPSPRYPQQLLAAEVEGVVTVQFATDAAGVPDMNTFRVVSTAHDLFTASVRNVLPAWRTTPNAQLQIPFVFVMADKTGAKPFEVPVNAVVITGVPIRVNTLAPAVSVAQGVGGYGSGPTPVNANQTYFEFQVEKGVSAKPGNIPARYPDELRKLNIEGQVLAQFVVDTTGAPIMDTFKVLGSSHELFTQAVRAALPDMRFYPALVGGMPVKQLVQMPFMFSLTK